MIEIMALPIAIVMTLSMWILLSAVFYKPEKYEYPSIKEGRFLEERTKSYYNFFALIFNIRDGSLSKDVKELELELAKLKSKDPLDREIADEEKEIKFLTEQKAKIDRLERLKREKDRLYQENETDSQSEDIDDKHINRTCGSRTDTGELGALESKRQSRISELKREFDRKYTDKMFEWSKSDDPEIRRRGISELKRIDPFLGSMIEFDNLRQEQMDENLNATRDEFYKALEMAEKEVRDKKEKIQRRSELEDELDQLYQENETDVQTEDTDDMQWCCQICGGTKVSSGVKYDDTGIERITVCSECRAVIK